MKLTAEQFLIEKLESEIQSFGDGTTEFHTRDIEHLCKCLDDKDDEIRELKSNCIELIAKINFMEDQIRELARQEAEKIFSERFSTLTNHSPDFISLKEFQKSYGVSAPTLYRHVNAGHINLVKMGGKSFLKRKQAEALFITVK